MRRIVLHLLLIICFSQWACSVEEKFKVISEVKGPVKTNCYLLYGSVSREAAIIDAGGPLDHITAYIAKNNLNLRYIFITHAHWDHVSGLSELQEKFPQAQLCLNQEEYSAMQKYLSYAQTSDPEKFAHIMQDSALAEMIQFDLTALKPDIFVRDQEEYRLGQAAIKTFFSPGHSAGSVCYVYDNFLFSGDVLFYRTVGNTDFYKASRPDLIQSVRRLYRVFPDSTIVYPGHGQFTDIGSEKKENKRITLESGEWAVP